MRTRLLLSAALLAVTGLAATAWAGSLDTPVLQLPGYKIQALTDANDATTMTETCDQAFGWSIYLADALTGEMRIVTLGASGVTSFPVDKLLPGEGPFWPAYDSQGLYTNEKLEAGPRIYVFADRLEQDFDELLQINSAQLTLPFLTETIANSESLGIDQLGWFNHNMFWVCGHVHAPESEGGAIQGEGGIQCELNHAIRRLEPNGDIFDVALVDEGCTQMIFTENGKLDSFDRSMFIANPVAGVIYRIPDNHVDGNPVIVWSSLEAGERPVGLALPTAEGWPEDRMLVTDAESESIIMVDSDGYADGVFATNIRSESATLLWGTCGPMTDILFLLTNDQLWMITRDGTPDEYYLPKRVRMHEKLNSSKPATLETRGTMEVGPKPIDLSQGALVRLGDYTIVVPEAESKGGKWVFEDDNTRYRILMAHEGGSKMRFKIDVEDDEMLGVIDSDAPMLVTFSNPEVDAGALVVMEEGSFQIGKKPGMLLDPDLYFYRCRGKYKGEGKDQLQLRFGIGEESEMAKGVGDAMSDMTINFDNAWVVTIPGDQFENKGGKFVFKGDIDGVTKVIYDTNKERMILYGKKLSLDNYAQGEVPLTIGLTVGEVTATMDVIMVREGDDLLY